MTSQTPHLRPARSRRRGFTFTEVMFAVVILGVGFIMLAAIFPVAIQQSRSNTQEATAGMVVQQALAALQRPGGDALLPKTGPTGSNLFVGIGEPYLVSQTKADAQLAALGQSQIYGSNPGYGWTMAWSRPVGSLTADVVIVITQVQDRDRYVGGTGPTDVRGPFPQTSPPTPATLQMKRFAATLWRATDGRPDRIRFDPGATPKYAPSYRALGEGSIILIANAGTRPLPGGNQAANGRILRLGKRLTLDPELISGDSDKSLAEQANQEYELLPGQDINSMPPQERPPCGDDSYGASIEVLTVGKSQREPGSAYEKQNNSYVAGAPDVLVYRALVPIRP